MPVLKYPNRGRQPTDSLLIGTPRLRLLPFTAADIDAVACLFSAPEVRRYLSIGPLDGPQALQFGEEFVVRSRDELREAGCGTLAMRQHDSDQLMGYCGLRPLPDRITAVELVFALAPPFWGQGFAGEAVDATLAWGLETLGCEEIVGLCRTPNVRSARVMERAGMHYRGLNGRYYGESLSLYSRRRDGS